MIDTNISLGAILISRIISGIFSLMIAGKFETGGVKVLLPSRQISNDASDENMLQSTITETMAVRMTLALQPDHKFQLSYTHACSIHRYTPCCRSKTSLMQILYSFSSGL